MDVWLSRCMGGRFRGSRDRPQVGIQVRHFPCGRRRSVGKDRVGVLVKTKSAILACGSLGSMGRAGTLQARAPQRAHSTTFGLSASLDGSRARVISAGTFRSAASPGHEHLCCAGVHRHLGRSLPSWLAHASRQTEMQRLSPPCMLPPGTCSCRVRSSSCGPWLLATCVRPVCPTPHVPSACIVVLPRMRALCRIVGHLIAHSWACAVEKS